LPALSRAKESGRRMPCVNNLKQLDLSLALYASDKEGQFTPRLATNRWTAMIQESYRDLRILVCPSDKNPKTGGGNAEADQAPRSYFINGWNDYFAEALNAAD